MRKRYDTGSSGRYETNGNAALRAEEPVRAQPFLKWAGGKWAIADQIQRLLPHDHHARPYREPFLGGGAMFFYLRPERAVLSDSLADLITAYQVVQHSVEALIKRLEHLRVEHSEEHFYEVRERFNQDRDATRVERAAWLVYLNKTCYNGLYRTNKDGGFNVPAGRYTNPGIVDHERLRLAAIALEDATIERSHFEDLVDKAEPGDVIYLDPPYVPLSRTANFAAYANGGFGPADQESLARTFRALDERGCLLALSNSDTPEVRRLYEGYDLSPIIAPRAISSKASTRGDVSELLIRNLDKYPKRPR